MNLLLERWICRRIIAAPRPTGALNKTLRSLRLADSGTPLSQAVTRVRRNRRERFRTQKAPEGRGAGRAESIPGQLALARQKIGLIMAAPDMPGQILRSLRLVVQDAALSRR